MQYSLNLNNIKGVANSMHNLNQYYKFFNFKYNEILFIVIVKRYYKDINRQMEIQFINSQDYSKSIVFKLVKFTLITINKPEEIQVFFNMKSKLGVGDDMLKFRKALNSRLLTI